MANVLKMTVIQTIHSLRSAGLSFREISRRLGIHRETVARYARMGSESVSKPSKVLISPAGSEERVDGFEVLTGSAGSNGSRNAAAPWLAWILDQRARGLQRDRSAVHSGIPAADRDRSAHQARWGRRVPAGAAVGVAATLAARLSPRAAAPRGPAASGCRRSARSGGRRRPGSAAGAGD